MNELVLHSIGTEKLSNIYPVHIGDKTTKSVHGVDKIVTPLSFITDYHHCGEEDNFIYVIEKALKIGQDYLMPNARRVFVGHMKELYPNKAVFTTKAFPIIDAYKVLKLVELLPKICDRDLSSTVQATNLLGYYKMRGDECFKPIETNESNPILQRLGLKKISVTNLVPELYREISIDSLREALESKPDNMVDVSKDDFVTIVLEGNMTELFGDINPVRTLDQF